MKVFDFSNYKEFCNKWVAFQPKNGRGQFRKIAHFLNISPVIVTQVLKGDRNFNEEQALELCSFLGLSKMEADYLLLLVKFEKAGTHKLKQYYNAKLKEISDKAKEVKSRLPKDKMMSEEAKATFYSNWYYSGIRLITAIPEYQTEEAISKYFNLPLKKVRAVIDFLVENNLCVRKGNKITCSEQSTHIDANSPLVSRHHKNWREQAAINMQSDNEINLFFTAPVVVDPVTAEKIRKEILNCIEKIAKEATAAPSEQLMCLNMDWFKI